MFYAFIFLCLLSASCQGSEFYALIVGETSDEELVSTVKKDIKLVRKGIEHIAELTQQTLHSTVMMGEEVTIDNVLQAIDTMQPGPDDTLFFYWNGHGFRAPWIEGKWPILTFGFTDEGLQLEDLNAYLLNKHPRLLVSIADCCNAVPEGLERTIDLDDELLLRGKKKKSKNTKALAKAYHKLFVEARGSIIASASKAGQIAYGIGSKGCFFTLQFLNTFDKLESGQVHANWSAVMKEAKKNTTKAAYALFSVEQTPQYEISLQ